MDRTTSQLLEKTRGPLAKRKQEALKATEGVPDFAYQVSPFVMLGRTLEVVTSPAFY